MCAIFGLLDYRGILTAAQRLRMVKALSVDAEIRGRDATGIAFFQREKLCIQKAAKPAHKMRYRIPAETRYIMGPEHGFYLYASTEGIPANALQTLGMEGIVPEVIRPAEGEILQINRDGQR